MCSSEIFFEKREPKPITPILVEAGNDLVLSVHSTMGGRYEIYRRTMEKSFICESVGVVEFRNGFGKEFGYAAVFAGKEVAG